MIITVDGLPVEVDDEAYAEDPERVIANIEAARAQASDLTGLHDEADWDYDSLVAAFGEDDTTPVTR